MPPATEEVRADRPGIQPFLAQLQERIGARKYGAWFRHGTRVAFENGHVKISVPNSFVAHWIEAHYRQDLSSAAEAVTGRKRPVLITIDPALAQDVRTRDLDRQAEIVSQATQGTARCGPRPAPSCLRHRLEDFVVGESNKLAYSAAVAVCSASQPPFNPLFVYGPCGVGKTHLLQGICNASAKGARRGARWRYVTAEEFTNEFIVALRQKRTAEFRRSYRNLGLLAIDDVHFLAAKEATQDEFLHTFNAIEAAGRQIVMASDAHPHLVGKMNDRLTSRFVSGMVVKIDVPDRPMRLALARRKAESLRLRAAPEVLDYVARYVRGSVREIEGALVKLSALSALEGKTVTVAAAAAALADQIARTDGVLTLDDIESVVAAFFGLTAADLHSSRRSKAISAARMMAAYLARTHTSMSYPEIGQHMGKSHSSIIQAAQRMERLLADDDRIDWMTPAGRKSVEAAKLLELLSEQFR